MADVDWGALLGAFFTGGITVGALGWIAGASIGFQKGLEARPAPEIWDYQ